MPIAFDASRLSRRSWWVAAGYDTVRPTLRAMVAGALVVVAAACGDTATGPGQAMTTGVIAAEVKHVMLPNIDSLANRGVRLATQISAFAAVPTPRPGRGAGGLEGDAGLVRVRGGVQLRADRD